MDVLDLVRGPRALRRWAVASLVANIAIVLTGGVVRLTASGLGCPTWPRCSAQSYVTQSALGVHGAIEFGNRLLTLVLVVVAVGTWLAAFSRRDQGRRRRDLRWLAGGMALGIPVQAVIGGISVLIQLNPFIVALHLLVSLILIALSVGLVRRTRDLRPQPTAAPGRSLAALSFGLVWLTVILGTLVTGSGPHAGGVAETGPHAGEIVPRTGFDGVWVTELHGAAVVALVAATVAAAVVLRHRAAVLLLVVETGQAAVGIAQYQLGLPIGLVLLHLLGAALAVAAATNLHLSVRRAPSAHHEPGATDVGVPAATGAH